MMHVYMYMFKATKLLLLLLLLYLNLTPDDPYLLKVKHIAQCFYGICDLICIIKDIQLHFLIIRFC